MQSAHLIQLRILPGMRSYRAIFCLCVQLKIEFLARDLRLAVFLSNPV